MGVLIFTPEDRELVKAALAAARAGLTPWAAMQDIVHDDRDDPTDMLTLDDKRRDAEQIEQIRKAYPPQLMQFGTYKVALSFEEHQIGIVKHISISSATPGLVPNEHAFAMIIKEFGFSGWPPERPHRIWFEEFETGHNAINLVELEP